MDEQQVEDPRRKTLAEADQIFNGVAEESEKETRRWYVRIACIYLLGVVFLAAHAIYAFYTLYVIGVDSMGTAGLLDQLVARVPLVVLILTGAFWCSRHYSVAKQQVVINRHRAHSIMTFRAFAEVADDPAVKDVVLTKAAECIFVHVPTGLARQDGSQPQNQVLVDVGKALNRTVAGGR